MDGRESGEEMGKEMVEGMGDARKRHEAWPRARPIGCDGCG